MEQVVHLFPVAVPDKIFGLTQILDFIDRCHSLTSLSPPQAALGSLPIPNTEVKHMYADKPHGRLPGKIGNANTKNQTSVWFLFYMYRTSACKCPQDD